MHYVYLLENASDPKQRYIGYTSDLRRRLREHNDGKLPTQRGIGLGFWQPI
jgi:putative endonuclease